MTTKLQFIVTNFKLPRLFRNPAISNFFFHFPWDFEIAGFNCSYSRSVLSHHIWGAEGLGEGCVKTSWCFLFVAYFYSWRWNLKSCYTASTLKWYYFSCYESLSKGTMFKWVYVVTRGGSRNGQRQCPQSVQTSSPRKNRRLRKDRKPS